MARNVFRRAALERLSTPERLDELVAVTSPRGWIALAALLGALAAAGVWAFAGSVTVRVEARGADGAPVTRLERRRPIDLVLPR